MKKKNILLGLVGLVLALFIVIGSCDNGNNNDNNGNNGGNGGNKGFLELARMDIEDANTVFIAPKPETSKDELYKITDNGNVEEVTYYDEEEKEMPMNRIPSAVYSVGTDYIIVWYGFTSNIGYLTRKSDGAVFSLGNVGEPYVQANIYRNTPVVQNDDKGNIYYSVLNSKEIYRTLLKIDVSNPNSLTATKYLPENDVLNYWLITPDSHIVYTYTSKTDNYIGGTRIRKSNGGLITLNSSLFWINLYGKINYWRWGSDIITVSIDADGSVSETSYSSNGIDQPGGGFFLKFTNKVIIAWYTQLFEVENEDKMPCEVNISDINDIKLAAQSNTHYYLAGNNSLNKPVLIKINPNNHSSIVLLLPDQYDVYSLSVSADDMVSFAATSMLNGANVIGEISATGQVKILDTTVNTKITVLERIR